MKQKRAKIGFTGCAKAYIRSLQEEGRYSTAHVYKNAVLSFTRFHGSTYIAFEQITPFEILEIKFDFSHVLINIS